MIINQNVITLILQIIPRVSIGAEIAMSLIAICTGIILVKMLIWGG